MSWWTDVRDKLKDTTPIKESQIILDYNEYAGALFEDSDGKRYTKHNLTDSIKIFTTIVQDGPLGYNGTFDDDWDPSKVGDIGPWWDCVCKMGKWYEQNIHTYQGTKGNEPLKGKVWYDCPLINSKVADDCSGFVQACLRLHGVNCPSIATATMQEQSFMKLMKDAGFVHLPYSRENLKPGDIVCGKASTHTEIFAGEGGSKGKSFSWGNIHDGKTARKCTNPQGMPCGFYPMGYIHIWRKA